MQNAVPFLLGAVLGPDASSHEDGTYDRLNYLLIKEFHLKRIDFTETEIPIDEISAGKTACWREKFQTVV